MDVQNILPLQTYYMHWTRISVIIMIPTRTHRKTNNDIIIIRFKTRDGIVHSTFILCHYQTITESLDLKWKWRSCYKKTWIEFSFDVGHMGKNFKIQKKLFAFLSLPNFMYLYICFKGSFSIHNIPLLISIKFLA